MTPTQPHIHFLPLLEDSFKMASDQVIRARESNWYAETEFGIAVLSYEDNAALMKHPNLTQGSAKWPEKNGVTEGPYYDWWMSNLLVLEGTDHDRIRRLVNPAFSRRKIDPFVEHFTRLAHELVDAFVDEGRCDFVQEFAAPYSTRVLCMILGIPESDWTLLHGLAATIGLGIGVHIRTDLSRIDKATVELDTFADNLIVTRRRNPGSDVVSTLIRSQSDGQSLTDRELRSLIILLIFAGIDTTRNQLALGVDLLAKDPVAWERIASDPERYQDRAAEECLRINPVARWVTREVARPFEHKGHFLEQGTTVHMFTLTSGTDPTEFPSGETVDLEARQSSHFAFGGGIHHCLGHFVARTDISIALGVLASRLTGLRVGDDAKWLHDTGNTGAITLPLTFSPRQK